LFFKKLKQHLLAAKADKISIIRSAKAPMVMLHVFLAPKLKAQLPFTYIFGSFKCVDHNVFSKETLLFIYSPKSF
jgi:hypothetical protein